MNGAENTTRVVTARLPSGVPIRVEVAGSGSDDGMTSVGLRDLDLDAALDAVAEIGSAVIEKLKSSQAGQGDGGAETWIRRGGGQADCTVGQWQGRGIAHGHLGMV